MQSVPTLAATSTIAVAAVGLNFAGSCEPRQYDDAIRPPTSRSSIMSRLTSSTRSSSRQQNPLAVKPNGSTHARDPSPLQARPPSSYISMITGTQTSLISAQGFSRPKSFALSFGSRPSTSAYSSISTQTSVKQPNKLVKRSASQKAPAKRPQTRSDRRVSSFPRPATSHARNLVDEAPVITSDETQAIDPVEIAGEDIHHFRPKVASADYTVELDSFGGSPFVRRICPDLAAPTLVTGGMLVPATLEVDHRLEGLVDSSSPWPSRPTTPANALSFSSPAPAPSTEPDNTETRGRRSFSINHLFRHSSAEKPKKVLRRKSRRLFSTPDGVTDAAEDPPISGSNPTNLAPSADAANLHSPLPSQAVSSPPTPPPTSHSRPSRPSTTPSEINSSHLGSDTGTRVFSSSDEDDFDFKSETNYDSIRTAFTKGANSTQGPSLQTLFNPPPELPEVPEWNDASSGQALNDSPGTIVPRGRKSNAEEESSNSTPVRTIIAPSQEGSRRRSSPRLRPSDSSSVDSSSHSQALSLGKLAWNGTADEEDMNWSGDEADDDWATPKTTVSRNDPTKKLAWGEVALAPLQTSHSPTRAGRSPSQYGPKSSLFDWAEQPNTTHSGANTPPRPKTVHGRKEPDLRGSRSTGRRAPSGLHARSHSVPVIADPAAQRTNVTNKFGTWGIGSKGVTEDWDDDFDFDEPTPAEKDVPVASTRSAASGMHVPTVILTAQNNVLANISLLREWGLLIEELKELRAKAGNIGVPIYKYQSTFDEVDAMIDLADQEAEDEGISGIKARASPGQAFDDGFDELEEERWNSPTKVTLIADDDVFGIPDGGSPKASAVINRLPSQPPIRTRPRKDSEAVARSVIEELHRRRSAQDPKLSKGPKMEFDTATLKHIVPYVNGLKRKVKDILREAEGLNTSPEHQRQPRGRPLSAIFDEEGPESPSAGRFKAQGDPFVMDDEGPDETLTKTRRMTSMRND